MKTVIDIGNAHAGIVVSYDLLKNNFTVKSHGPGQDERTVETDELLAVIHEVARQSITLGLEQEYADSHLSRELLKIGESR